LHELRELRQHDWRVKIIVLSRNFGQAQAIVAGLHHASGDLIISLSADLQDPIEMIPQMIKECEAGNEVVICNRIQRSDTFKDKLFAGLYYQLMKTSNINLPKGGFDLFLLSKKANDEMKKIDERNRYLHADILWLGFSIKFLPGVRKKRTIGRSQYSFKKKLNSLIIGYLNTSYFPLRIMSVIGLLSASIGFVYAYQL
jgi:glycosyltransferase involved in cell wall biosynthesis